MYRTSACKQASWGRERAIMSQPSRQLGTRAPKGRRASQLAGLLLLGHEALSRPSQHAVHICGAGVEPGDP